MYFTIHQRAFCHLELSDSNFKLCPNALEWDKIRRICTFLGVFYDVTNVFSGTKYPAANLYYPHVFMAYLTLFESMSSNDEYIKKMAELMMTKFQKYWSHFSLTLAIAVVLDPRYKLHFINLSYSQIYGEASPEYSNGDQFLNSTFNEYVNMLNVAGDDKRDDATRASNDFDQFQSKDFTINKKSKLQMYLEESRVDRSSELDVLAFWKANEFRYPALVRMARDFLTIPVSTVASESMFSASGRFVDSNQVSVDELTEDIMSLDVSRKSDASNSVNNPKVSTPNASSSVAC
ncbi:zinc finger BED domain-containing protein DAYSLEEPER-like [Helianthus annuus]|uniref:zinc finger BED domain-containing protein DAYSLEEPER-like n=1 Tax=Helianthus annuus TaxID=4232 RepID=UPI000B8F052E|nr:zinc finger BED domain-containing protein DAYSLEEPER-like [Helianthus annuus]